MGYICGVSLAVLRGSQQAGLRLQLWCEPGSAEGLAAGRAAAWLPLGGLERTVLPLQHVPGVWCEPCSVLWDCAQACAAMWSDRVRRAHLQGPAGHVSMCVCNVLM